MIKMINVVMVGGDDNDDDDDDDDDTDLASNKFWPADILFTGPKRMVLVILVMILIMVVVVMIIMTMMMTMITIVVVMVCCFLSRKAMNGTVCTSTLFCKFKRNFRSNPARLPL